MILRVCDAARRPLAEPFVLKVFESQSLRCVRAVTSTTATVQVDGLRPAPYLVQVFPLTHRPVSQFVVDQGRTDLFTPLDPDRVTTATFPAWDALPAALQGVLIASALEGSSVSGRALYDLLTDVQRAGLLNLHTKMAHEALNDEVRVWSYVIGLYRIRQDRIFATVQSGLRDLVKSSPRFQPVPGVLHTPPPGFQHAGSFKTTDPYGNLHLTFFCTPDLQFRIDADIDNAAGVGHVFQVFSHALAGGTTHPYDIHQILTFRQDVTMPYTLE